MASLAYEDQVQEILDKYSGSSGEIRFEMSMMTDEELEELDTGSDKHIDEKIDGEPIYIAGFKNAEEAAKYWYEQFKRLDEMIMNANSICLE